MLLDSFLVCYSISAVQSGICLGQCCGSENFFSDPPCNKFLIRIRIQDSKSFLIFAWLKSSFLQLYFGFGSDQSSGYLRIRIRSTVFRYSSVFVECVPKRTSFTFFAVLSVPYGMAVYTAVFVHYDAHSDATGAPILKLKFVASHDSSLWKYKLRKIK